MGISSFLHSVKRKLKSLWLLGKEINDIKEMVGQKSEKIDRKAIYLGNNRAVTTTVYGHKILVDTRDVSLSPHILIDGFWEKWITDVFLRMVKPGMRVVGIGSNIGFYSLLTADRVGENGFVTCFDANAELADLTFHSLC